MYSMFYVYVLDCVDEGKHTLYTGFTSNLRQRIKHHRAGNTKTTKKFDKFSLVYYEACVNEQDARKREVQLKTGFGRGYLKNRLKNYLILRD